MGAAETMNTRNLSVYFGLLMAVFTLFFIWNPFLTSDHQTVSYFEHQGFASGKLWHYQLQDYNCSAIGDWNFDFVVVDPDEFNCPVSKIKGAVLAYISVGEAEDYRGYWERLPKDIVLYENPYWKGNYVVRFWDPRWKQIIFQRIKRALSRGFDGVYLDRVDVYEELNRREEMIELLREIYELVKTTDPNAYVFVQNAVELYPEVKNIVDGFGKEDTWFYDDRRIGGDGLRYLRMARDDGKVILAIDYPQEENHVCTFYRLCKEEGFYCTVGNRELNLSHPITCSSS